MGVASITCLSNIFELLAEIKFIMCHSFVSAGDALRREHPATLMSSFLAEHSGCK